MGLIERLAADVTSQGRTAYPPDDDSHEESPDRCSGRYRGTRRQVRRRPGTALRPGVIHLSRAFARSNRYARWAWRKAKGKGDTICLMPNRPEFLALWLGVTRIGGVVALLNTNLTGTRSPTASTWSSRSTSSSAAESRALAGRAHHITEPRPSSGCTAMRAALPIFRASTSRSKGSPATLWRQQTAPC